MRYSTSFKNSALRLTAAFAIVSLLAGSAARAEDKKPSRISGKVMTSDGKPAANLQVKIAPLAVAKGSGGGHQQGRKSTGFELPSFSRLLAPPAPLKSVTTDATGAFDFGKIPVGEYKVTAGDPRSVGLAVEIVNVDGSGNDITQDMTLTPPAR